MLARPTADIASFPSPGWTTAPLFSNLNSVEPDDSTFITGLAPGAEDPQVALQLADLEIPYGASGQIIVRVRIAWDAAPTLEPTMVRIGLAPVSALGVDNPTLYLERRIIGFTSTDFTEVEVVFNYSDWAGDSSAFGLYLEMTPNGADSIVPLLAWVEVDACAPASIISRCSLGNITARSIIRQARDYSVTFEPRKHPDGVLLRVLSSFENDVAAMCAKVNPSLLASTFEQALPLAVFADGISLPQFTYMLPGATLRNANNPESGHYTPFINATMQHRLSDYDGRALYLQGQKAFLAGVADQYNGFSAVQFRLILTPENLTDVDDLLQLPDHLHDAYTGALVKIMAIRDKDAALTQIGQGMIDTAYTTLAQQKSAEVFVTADVWPGSY